MIPEQQPLPPPAPKPSDRVRTGVGIAIAIEAATIGLGATSFIGMPEILLLVLLGWGVAQWIGLIPAYFVLRGKQQPLAAKGILIMGCIGFLLNAGCFALVMGVAKF
jgi:hypothetical protein